MALPLIIAAATTAGAAGWWWSSKDEKEEEKEEATFQKELWKVGQPILIILVIVLLARWAYNRGAKNNQTNGK